MAQTNSLPEFENPPVSEVALSVEFSPLENWNSSHAFAYGKLVDATYPKMEVHPALPSEMEKFGEEFWQKTQFRVELVTDEQNRFWFLANPENWLIQVQQDRFVLNWRQVKGNEVYPRYVNGLKPRFESEWERFRNFVAQQNIGNIDITQCEVTYVNDIPKGEAWNTISEAAELISPLSGNKVNEFLPSFESINLFGSYLLPEQKGRMRVMVNHVLRQLDRGEVLQMRLFVRGRPQSSSNNDLLEWLDMAREWIVRGFTDLTTNKAHKLWRRIS